MGSYIITDDFFGVHTRIRQIFTTCVDAKGLKRATDYYRGKLPADWYFNVFYNQYLPDPFKCDTASVMRHSDEIAALAKRFIPSQVWCQMNGSLSCLPIAPHLLSRKDIRLLTYVEIEKEQNRLQQLPTYRKELGITPPPIEEELITLRIHTREGVKQ